MRAANEAQTWTAGGRPRLKGLAKSAVRQVVDRAVQIMPGSCYRLADYILSTRPRPARPAKATRSEKPTRQERLRIPVDELLAQAGPALTHADVLTLLKSAGGLHETALHRYLTALFVARRLDVMQAAVECEALDYPETRLFHALKLAQYRGESARKGEDLDGCFERLNGHPMFADAAANLIADLIARTGDTSHLSRFLVHLTPDQLSRLAPATFLGCMRLLQGAEPDQRLASLRQAYLARLSDEQRLYFLEILPITERSGFGGWRDLVERFATAYTAADAEDRHQLRLHVIRPLARIPAGEHDLMSIRFDAGQRAGLMGRLTDALAAGRGVGLVRLGDGEAYGYAPTEIAGIAPEAFIEDNLIRERMWWGTTIDEPRRETIRRRFREAVASADIIGVPSIYRIIRDRSTPYTRFGSTGGQRGLATVLSQLGEAIPTAGRILTEERCHQILFDRSGIEALCKAARRVVVVSCWTREQLRLDAHPDIHNVVIPGHTKVAKATGMGPETRALFDTFEAQVTEMAACCAPGTLVLVGAGFLGKVFIAEAKAKGAVALDVGAVLDYLVGFKTRSLADLV